MLQYYGAATRSWVSLQLVFMAADPFMQGLYMWTLIGYLMSEECCVSIPIMRGVIVFVTLFFVASLLS